jgi:hypothetical protein
MKKIGLAGYPFIALGIAFIAIGFSSSKPFIAIGVAFIGVGFVLLTRK